MRNGKVLKKFLSHIYRKQVRNNLVVASRATNLAVSLTLASLAYVTLLTSRQISIRTNLKVIKRQHENSISKPKEN